MNGLNHVYSNTSMSLLVFKNVKSVNLRMQFAGAVGSDLDLFAESVPSLCLSYPVA